MPAEKESMTPRQKRDWLKVRGERHETDNVGIHAHTDDTQKLQFHIKRVKFARHRRFRWEDHLFQIKVEANSRRRNPLLLSTTEGISRGVAAVINKLQELYDPKERHQVYISFEDRNFQRGGLNSGNYELFPHDDDERAISRQQQATLIAEQAVGALSVLLRSNDSLRLDENFLVYCHVLSARHLARRLSARKPPREPNHLPTSASSQGK